MSFQSSESHVDDDLTLLSETLEEVLRSSGDPADQKYIELKARADDYVREKPWQGIGVGAAAGLVLGLLLARR